MQCSLKCPKCKETHEINSQFCASCGFDLEPYIIRFKDKHLPIHFDGGIDADDACDCLGDCCCGGSSKKQQQQKKQGCCENSCDCLCDCL